MRDVRLLIKNGVILTSAIILAGGLSFTSFAATDDPTSGEGDGAVTNETSTTTDTPATSEAIDSVNGTQDPTAGLRQEDENSQIGYNTRSQGFNVFAVDNGTHIRSTYGDAGYGTYVNDTESGTINSDAGSFQYGTPYEHNGLTTTIVPTLGESSVSFEYNVTNNTDQTQTFVVGSSADTQVGNNRATDDYATIYGDPTGFTMTNGRYAMQISSGEHPFDNLWYGDYSDRNDHFRDNNVMTSMTDPNTDSGVVWGWNITLEPGRSATRSAGVRIGASSDIIPTTTTTTEKVYQEWGPGPEAAPRVWYAWTEKGEQLPITNMGTADATTSTLYIDISGASTVQYKDVIKDAYAKAPAGGVFVIGTSTVSVIDKEMAENFATRSDVTVKFVFPNGDQVLCVSTPAGFNFGSILDDTGFAGFLKLAATCGSSVIG